MTRRLFWTVVLASTVGLIYLGYTRFTGNRISTDTAPAAPSMVPVTSEPLAASMVRLIGLDELGREQCSGTGVIIDERGLILSSAPSWWEAESCSSASIEAQTTNRAGREPLERYRAEVLDVDLGSGLSIVRVAGPAQPGDDTVPIAPFPVISPSNLEPVTGSPLRILRFSEDDELQAATVTVTGPAAAAGADALSISSPVGPAIAIDTSEGLVGASVPAGAEPAMIRRFDRTAALSPRVLDRLASSPVVGGDDIEFSNPRFSSASRNEAPSDELVVGTAGSRRLCLFTDWSGIPDGTRWDAVWNRDGEPIREYSIVGSIWNFGPEGKNFWTCAIDNSPEGLRPGLYEFAVFMNGTMAFAEGIRVEQNPSPLYPVTFVNRTGTDICGLAVNPWNSHNQAGANELANGERIGPAASVTVSVAQGPILVETRDCDGTVLADSLDGLEITEPTTLEITG